MQTVPQMNTTHKLTFEKNKKRYCKKRNEKSKREKKKPAPASAYQSA
jgi:hypothetical protein